MFKQRVLQQLTSKMLMEIFGCTPSTGMREKKNYCNNLTALALKEKNKESTCCQKVHEDTD